MFRGVRLALAAALLVLGGTSSVARAAPVPARIVDVTIQNFAYSPNPITIDPGDTIRWTNLDAASHSAVSVRPGFISEVLSQGQSTTTIFDHPGTLEYVCAVHGASMKGTVIVRGTPVETAPVAAGPVGHLVSDSYQQARPDLQPITGAPAALLYATALLALAAVARFVWVLRHG